MGERKEKKPSVPPKPDAEDLSTIREPSFEGWTPVPPLTSPHDHHTKPPNHISRPSHAPTPPEPAVESKRPNQAPPPSHAPTPPEPEVESDSVNTLRQSPETANRTILLEGNPAPIAPGAATAPLQPHQSTPFDNTTPDSKLGHAAASGGVLGEVTPGKVLFDRYLVDLQIGSGGMGTVWKVKHKVLGVSRALKLIRPQIAFDPKTRADFRREATIMANLHHPTAVMVHDAQIGSDLAYIEMELLEGESIEKMTEPGKPMPLDWITRILLQLCELLEFVHTKGIIHRDLKPSNLMLLAGYPEGREFLKVLDFGIAKSLNQENADPEDIKTSTGGARFTPHYASPEQVGGAHDLDARSDLYSVGVILYEFLTGYRPFSEPGLIYQHLCVPAPAFKTRNPQCTAPAGVEAVVLRCLSKDPAERPQTAGELGQAFLTAVEETGIALTIPGTHQSRWESRSTISADSKLTTKSKASIAGDELPSPRSKPRNLALALVVVPLLIVVAFVAVWMARGKLGPVTVGPNTTPSTNSGDSAGTVVKTTTTTVPPPVIPVRKVTLALGYEPALEARYNETGWPEEIVDSRSQARFTRFSDGIYVPSAFDTGDPKDVVNGWPRVLTRKGTVGGRFIRIEGGSFTMGGLLPEKGADRPEDRPAHRVTLDDFYLHETEISNRQMQAFFDATTLSRPQSWDEYYANLSPDDRLKLPDRATNFVSRQEAAEFSHWVGGRLPTEAEWEYAARSRGREDRLYPWGKDESGKVLGNINNAEINLGSTIPIAVSGRYTGDRTREGIVDMGGNVREWCYDEFSPYTVRPIVQGGPVELVLKADKEYVVRGSAFDLDIDAAFTTDRSKETCHQRAGNLGFRVVLKVPPKMTVPLSSSQ